MSSFTFTSLKSRLLEKLALVRHVSMRRMAALSVFYAAGTCPWDIFQDGKTAICGMPSCAGYVATLLL
eukprot:630627-Prorocentrum_lima.AAC.1